jgi:hypothetical protein
METKQYNEQKVISDVCSGVDAQVRVWKKMDIRYICYVVPVWGRADVRKFKMVAKKNSASI